MEQSSPQVPASRIALLALGLLTLLFVLFVYTFLHEAGHALTGLAFGQTLTAFSVNFWDFSAHVGLDGSLTAAQRAVQSAAGAALPFLLWALFIILVPRKGSFALELLKLVGSMAVVNSLLPWIVIPVLALLGQSLPSDDVTHFLQASQTPPLLLVAAAAILYALGWSLFLARIDGLRRQFQLFKQDVTPSMSSIRPVMLAMAAIIVFCLGITLAASAVAAGNRVAPPAPPPDFQLAAEIDLSSQPHVDHTLLQFSLDETTPVGIFFSVRNIDTPYFDLSLVPPSGDSLVILHGEGFRTDDNGGGLWEETLPPGTYRLLLNAHESPGTLTIYWGYR